MTISIFNKVEALLGRELTEKEIDSLSEDIKSFGDEKYKNGYERRDAEVMGCLV